MAVSSLLSKGAVKLFHGAKKDFTSFDSRYATETAFGRGFSFTPDKKVAESYARIKPSQLKKLYGKKYLGAAIERKREGEPLLYQVEANLKDNETLIVRKNFSDQNEQVQKKLKTLIEEENINIDDLDLDKPKFWRQILNITEKDADELFSKYGIKGSIKDARGSSIKQVGGELEYTIYDPSILKIVDKMFLDKNKKYKGGEMKKNKKRMQYAEGSMLTPPEMQAELAAMEKAEAPIEDTYSNIPEDEIAETLASQKPDAEMEETYQEFILDQALNPEEQEFLMGALQQSPELTEVFDKILTVSSEFSGAGAVKGIGTGTSDSIPARLSDGEFVITAKATEYIGAQNLQRIMDEAERAYDEQNGINNGEAT
jgi:hypothetical protein